MPKYKARAGFRVSDKQAQIIGDEVNKIKNENDGICTAKMFYKKVKNPKHPCHNMGYIWDDRKAAIIQRVEHSRYLIRSIIEIGDGVATARDQYAIELTEMDDKAYYSAKKVRISDPCLSQVSNNFYRNINTICDEVVHLGLDKKCKEWKNIVKTVKSNIPQLYK